MKIYMESSPNTPFILSVFIPNNEHYIKKTVDKYAASSEAVECWALPNNTTQEQCSSRSGLCCRSDLINCGWCFRWNMTLLSTVFLNCFIVWSTLVFIKLLAPFVAGSRWKTKLNSCFACWCHCTVTISLLSVLSMLQLTPMPSPSCLTVSLWQPYAHPPIFVY